MKRFLAAFAAAVLVLVCSVSLAGVPSYSTTPANNNSAPPNGAPEGMTPGSVNDVIRQLMTDTAIEAQINRVKYLNSVTGTNTITASMAPALTAYSAGMMVVMTPAGSNTGAATLAVNGLLALDIQKFDGDALIAGDLVIGVPALLMLDAGADDWLLVNPQGGVLSNGVSMSDLARLSQNNIFTGGYQSITGSGSGAVVLSDTSAAADEKRWRLRSIGGFFAVTTETDAGTGTIDAISVDRTGTTPISIALTSTALTWNANTLFTTANDGAGSLLDADLLDGLSSAAFAQLASSATFNGEVRSSGQFGFTAGIAGFMELVNRSGGAFGLKIYHGANGTGPVTEFSSSGSLTVPGTSLTVNGTSVRDAAILTSGTVPVARGGTGTTTSTGTGSVVLSASPTLTGTVTGGTFSGSGASLTSLNATQLTSGTIPDARIASTGVTQHQASLAINESQVTSDFANNDTSFSVSSAMAGDIREVDSASAVTITVGTDALGATGKAALFIRRGAGTVTFSASGTTLRTPGGLAITVQHGTVGLIQLSTTEYQLTGNL